MLRAGHDLPDLPQKEALSEVASHLLEECRMVLPGIQALFGFQLMAVFNPKFWGLVDSHRVVHLVAIGLVAVAVALVMTPAAYHRLAMRNSVSQSFIDLSSRLLLCSMFPLLVGICLDFYVISTMILSDAGWGMALSLALTTVFGSLWFGLPYLTLTSRTDSSNSAMEQV
jgi:hypothetical protein